MKTNLEVYVDFADESNKIEGMAAASDAEVAALVKLAGEPELTMHSVIDYVRVVQPDAELRSREGLNVRVGDYIAPRGGQEIVEALQGILGRANVSRFSHSTTYQLHQEYEHLHPFTDGNGRSGRAVWLWMMGGSSMTIARYGFLHSFYYQALDGWKK